MNVDVICTIALIVSMLCLIWLVLRWITKRWFTGSWLDKIIGGDKKVTFGVSEIEKLLWHTIYIRQRYKKLKSTEIAHEFTAITDKALISAVHCDIKKISSEADENAIRKKLDEIIELLSSFASLSAAVYMISTNDAVLRQPVLLDVVLSWLNDTIKTEDMVKSLFSLHPADTLNTIIDAISSDLDTTEKIINILTRKVTSDDESTKQIDDLLNQICTMFSNNIDDKQMNDLFNQITVLFKRVGIISNDVDTESPNDISASLVRLMSRYKIFKPPKSVKQMEALLKHIKTILERINSADQYPTKLMNAYPENVLNAIRSDVTNMYQEALNILTIQSKSPKRGLALMKLVKGIQSAGKSLSDILSSSYAALIHNYPSDYP